MIVYVVKTIVYGYRDDVDVYGVYSNLALAGRAAMQFIDNDSSIITFTCDEEPWGYLLDLEFRDNHGSWWQYGQIEIGRMIVNV